MLTPSIIGFFPFFLLRFSASWSKALASSSSLSSISLRILWFFLLSYSEASLLCSASSVIFCNLSRLDSSSLSCIRHQDLLFVNILNLTIRNHLLTSCKKVNTISRRCRSCSSLRFSIIDLRARSRLCSFSTTSGKLDSLSPSFDVFFTGEYIKFLTLLMDSAKLLKWFRKPSDSRPWRNIYVKDNLNCQYWSRDHMLSKTLNYV